MEIGLSARTKKEKQRHVQLYITNKEHPMRSKKILSVMAIVAMILATPQHANAQFWKQLGKVAGKVGKAILESPTAQTTENQSTTSTQSENKNIPRYKIHRTADTKTVKLRGGVEFMGGFSEGYAIVSQKDNKSWFIINKKGEKVFDLPDEYKPSLQGQNESFYKVRFNSGRLLIEKSTGYITKDVSIIDTLGNVIKTFKEVSTASQFNDGVAIIAYHRGAPCFIDIDGNVISNSVNLYKNNYYWVGPLCEGLRFYVDNSTQKYGYLDEKCNISISPRFKNCSSFNEGLAVVQNDEGLWGYIDKTGKYVIEPMFTNYPFPFNNGYARVVDKSNQIHFIDKTGRIIWTTSDDRIWTTGGKWEWPSFTNNGFLIGNDIILDTSF